MTTELRDISEANEEDAETMDSKVLKVSALLVLQSDFVPRKLALVHFFAVLGYDARKYEELEKAEPRHSDDRLI
jgi:hypothetical protein